MLKPHPFLIIACLTTGCAATSDRDSAFVEWQGYELATAKPPPHDYLLVGDKEDCRPATLNECTYWKGNFALSYYDGRLISKEAVLRGVVTGEPLISELAAAGSEKQVIYVLRKQRLAGYSPDCFDADRVHKCGVIVSADPSVYLQARFSSRWKLISISYNVPDAL